MCGIAGRFKYRTRAPVDRIVRERTCDLITHRKPDGSDAWLAGAEDLLFIDARPTGAPPVHSPAGVAK